MTVTHIFEVLNPDLSCEPNVKNGVLTENHEITSITSTSIIASYNRNNIKNLTKRFIPPVRGTMGLSDYAEIVK